MDPPATAPVAGWYPDPEHPGSERYWDGAAWTAQRRVGTIAAAAGAPGGVPAGQPSVVIQASPTNGMAVAGLVCGIIGVVSGLIPWTFWLAWILGILAIVFGSIGRNRATIDPRAGRQSMGTAGIVLGIIALVLGVVGVLLFALVIDTVTSCIEDPFQARCD